MVSGVIDVYELNEVGVVQCLGYLHFVLQHVDLSDAHLPQSDHLYRVIVALTAL